MGCHATAASEALSLAESLDLSLDKEGNLLPLLERSWGASKILTRCGNEISKVNGDFYSKEIETSSAPLKNLVKDLKIIDRTARLNDLGKFSC